MLMPLKGCEAKDFIKVETPIEEKYAHPSDADYIFEQEYEPQVPSIYGEL